MIADTSFSSPFRSDICSHLAGYISDLPPTLNHSNQPIQKDECCQCFHSPLEHPPELLHSSSAFNFEFLKDELKTERISSFKAAQDSQHFGQLEKYFLSNEASIGLYICLKCRDPFCHKHLLNHHYKFHPASDASGYNSVYCHIINSTLSSRKRNSSDLEPSDSFNDGEDIGQKNEPFWQVKWKCFCCLNEVEPPREWIDKLVHSLSAEQTNQLEDWNIGAVGPCEHTLCLEQIPPDSSQFVLPKKCSECDISENLWFCLTCGNVGCGRRQYDGSGGNNHGVDHFGSTGHPVACKLGTITADGKADINCYLCDDMKLDPMLADHLNTFGINIKEEHKTEKSMAELQLEQNLNYQFSMTTQTEDGQQKTLNPIFGKGLTGMRNIGNSCYIASVLQSVFDVSGFDQFSDIELVTKHHYICKKSSPSNCLICQLIKIFAGLVSGVYSVPGDDSSDPDADLSHLPESIRKQALLKRQENREKDPNLSKDALVQSWQVGISPFSLKQLLGKGHTEFSTSRQQDAFEFFQYVLDKSDKELATCFEFQRVSDGFEFVVTSRFQCSQCQAVTYRDEKTTSLSLPVPLRKKPREFDKDELEYEDVTLDECLDMYAAPEKIDDFKCTRCNAKVSVSKTSSFKSMPKYLVLHAQRFILENWTPKKLPLGIRFKKDCPIDLMKYIHKPNPDETLMPQQEEASNSNYDYDEAELEQIMSMGFSKNRAIRSLIAIKEIGASGVEQAVEWLFARMDDPSLDEELEPAGKNAQTGNSNDKEHESMIENLQQMGFDKKMSQLALENSQWNMERAVELLFSGAELVEQQPSSSQYKEPSIDDVIEKGSKNSSKFSLHAIVAHKGRNTASGHYVCYREQASFKHGKRNSEWVLFNDEKVVLFPDIDTSSEVASCGYLYILKSI